MMCYGKKDLIKLQKFELDITQHRKKYNIKKKQNRAKNKGGYIQIEDRFISTDKFQQDFERAINAMARESIDSERALLFESMPDNLEVVLYKTKDDWAIKVRVEGVKERTLAVIAYWLLRALKVFSCDIEADGSKYGGSVSIEEDI